MINIITCKIPGPDRFGVLEIALGEKINHIQISVPPSHEGGIDANSVPKLKARIKQLLEQNAPSYLLGFPASFLSFYNDDPIPGVKTAHSLEYILKDYRFDLRRDYIPLIVALKENAEGSVSMSDILRFLTSDKRSTYICAPSMSGKTFMVDYVAEHCSKILSVDMDSFGCRGVQDPTSEWYFGSRVYTALKRNRFVPNTIRICMFGCCTNQIEVIRGFNEMHDVKTAAIAPAFDDWLALAQKAASTRSEWWVNKFGDFNDLNFMSRKYTKALLTHVLFSEYYMIRKMEE